MTASEARLHLRYSAWASRKLVDAAAALPPESLDRKNGISHGSILGTLAHIQFGDWIWYTRAMGPVEKPGGSLQELQTVWPSILDKWIAWADALSDADLTRAVDYKAMDGKAFRTPLWQIVLHVVNHATLHRGQVMGMLRQAGVAPPGTDLIYYYRELDGQ